MTKAVHYIWRCFIGSAVAFCFTSSALAAKPAKMATDIPAGIPIPNELKTPLGTLTFDDGRPDQATVQKLYDNLDFQRGVQAFLNTTMAGSMAAMRDGLRGVGAGNDGFVLFETLTNARSLFLTANTDTVYAFSWADTREGPLVIEVPSNVLILVDDAFQKYVGDMGNAGPDKGKGGKYVLLPPGYTGEVPEGYFVLRSPTYGNWIGGRGFVLNGDPRATAEHMKRSLRIYPLAKVNAPPPTHFVNGSGKAFNTVHSNDLRFFHEIDSVVQHEPQEAFDAETRGLLAAIGIRKGTPFNPDARMKKILNEAALVGAATARALVFETRNPDAYFYPSSDWRTAFIGGSHEFSPGGTLDLDARAQFAYTATGITPAMAKKMVGVGSQYAYASHDAKKQLLDGGKNYVIRMPAGIPAKNFWSLTTYDTQTRSYLQTDQDFPSISSARGEIVTNSDGSVDVHFGPKPPTGNASNWIQTMPGQGWFVMLRLYGPLQPWFDKTWQPGEITEVK
jgi:hypothetical protein